MGYAVRSAEAVILGSVSLAALHALIPSHWLAFALVGRAQHWSRLRTVKLAVMAGTGHVLVTIALGLSISAVGKAALSHIPPQLEHAAASASLILLGLYFLVPALKGKHGCRHPHEHTYPLEENSNAANNSNGVSIPLSSKIANTSTMGALVMGMTLSPCLDLLPIYVAASALHWETIALLSIVMAVTTVGIMSFLVWLTTHGLERLKLNWLEENEGLAIGGLLIALGIFLFWM